MPPLSGEEAAAAILGSGWQAGALAGDMAAEYQGEATIGDVGAWLVAIDIRIHRTGSPSAPHGLAMATLGLVNRRRLFHVK